ncbi:flippase [Prosthecochloris vibrioformis]|uniref:Flippase n=1 Tax=Prosthecochloris vibrioformis TaxID=1098 RepID=A0A5C4S1U5_PROVB|nr:flippase [Prosthecochloris vibrioformis]TNJ37430.1 flippase [Prosthecochloris vibrioformis]
MSSSSNPFWLRYTPQFIRQRLEGRASLHSILHNIGWLFVDKILRMGVGLLIGVWVARYLGPEQFGLLNFAGAFTGLFGAIAGLGLQGIVVRDIVRHPENARVTLGTAGVLQLAGGLLSFLLIFGTITYLRPDDALARSIVAILGSMMLLKAGEIALYWFEAKVQSKYTVVVQNSVFVLFAAVKVVLILQQAPLIMFAWAMLAEAFVAAIVLIVVMGIYGPAVSQLRFSLDRAKTLLHDSWPLILSAIAITIYMKIDQIMLAQMIDDAAVGVYSVAVRMSEVWYFIPIAIVASVFPAILEAKKRNETLYYTRLQQLYDHLTMLGIVVAVVMTIISTQLITLLFGEIYADAGSILQIHIWAGIFVSMGLTRGKWMLAENLQYMGYWYVGIGMVVNVVGNYVMIPTYGGLGAAWSTLVSQAVVAVIAPAFYQKTRLSSIMLVRSLSPLQWYLRLRGMVEMGKKR